MNAAERIAFQLERVRADAEAASKKAPPRACPPRGASPTVAKISEEEVVRRFLEDRVYDDIPVEKSKIDPDRIRSIRDIRRVMIAEQPREYVLGPARQTDRHAPTFREIGMDSLEGPGYSMLKRDTTAELQERIVETPSDSTAAHVEGIKIDLRPQTAPASPRPSGAMEITDMQRQMMAALRAQRNRV